MEKKSNAEFNLDQVLGAMAKEAQKGTGDKLEDLQARDLELEAKLNVLYSYQDSANDAEINRLQDERLMLHLAIDSLKNNRSGK